MLKSRKAKTSSKAAKKSRKKTSNRKGKSRQQPSGASETPKPLVKKTIKDNYDKYEVSPNSLAKCVSCNKKIQQGTKRIGTEIWSNRFGYYYRYYHERCCPASIQNQLKLPGGSPQQELRRQEELQQKAHHLLIRRHELRESLRRLRLLFARQLGVGDKVFLVFHDKTLDELTIHMPRTQQQALKIFGIGPKRFQNFGEPILEVIRHFLKLYDDQSLRRISAMTSSRSRPATATTRVAAAATKTTTTPRRDRKMPAMVSPPGKAAGRASLPAVVNIDDDDDDDDDAPIVLEETLSCEEIVRRKFAHAATHGYVIALEEEDEE